MNRRAYLAALGGAGTAGLAGCLGDVVSANAAYFASGGYDSEQAARDAWNGSKGAIESDETWEHTFEVAGTYEYFCIPHEVGEMLGTVVVEEADGE